LCARSVAVEPYWPKLFAGLLKGRDVAELLSNVGGGSAPAAAPAAGGAAPAAAGKKEEPKKEEPKEEEEGDMGFSLFD
jgi:large subunit ribosomal protein LP1